MAANLHRSIVAACLFAVLCPLALCTDDSREERQQKREREPSTRGAGRTGSEGRKPWTRGAGRTGSEGLHKHDGPGSKEAAPSEQQGDDCDCSRQSSRGPMSKEVDTLRRKGGVEKRDSKRGQDREESAQKNHTSDWKVVSGKWKQEDGNATWKWKHEGRNVSRSGNETRDRGSSPSTHRGGKGAQRSESKGKCDCAQAGRKNKLMSKDSEVRTVSHSLSGDSKRRRGGDSKRRGSGDCKGQSGDSKRRRKGGRFLQKRGRDAACDEDDDGLPVAVILGAAVAGIAILCITVGLLCVCCRRSVKTAAYQTEKESAGVVVICDVKNPTSDGVVSNSAGVVVGNPVTNAQKI